MPLSAVFLVSMAQISLAAFAVAGSGTNNPFGGRRVLIMGVDGLRFFLNGTEFSIAVNYSLSGQAVFVHDNNDDDSDGYSNYDESRLGTNLQDANSYFKLEQTILIGGDIQITRPSASGTAFTIRSSTDLNDWSTIVASGVSATSGTSTSYNLGPPSGPNTFYRVELE